MNAKKSESSRLKPKVIFLLTGSLPVYSYRTAPFKRTSMSPFLYYLNWVQLVLFTHVKKIKGTALKNGEFYFRIHFFADGCEQAVS